MLYALCSGKAKGPIPQDAVQALDVALKNTASNHPDCVTLPRAFFFYDREMVKTVGGGAEVKPQVCRLRPLLPDAYIHAQYGKHHFFGIIFCHAGLSRRQHHANAPVPSKHSRVMPVSATGS